MLTDRFWSKVDKSSDCWLWTACGNALGYGTFGIGGKMRLAHRLSFEDSYGPIAFRKSVDHLCGNRRCVRPEHLDAVTQLENVRRGRRAKLTIEKAREIRHSYADREMNQRQLADRYGVSKQTVQQLIAGVTWIEENDDVDR